jgi:nucleotidyltransferase substrate binding protein (TIGR01987 family)
MVSGEGLQNHFQRLEKAYIKLNEALEQEYSEYIRDSVIKRFELVFELLWKFLKRLAELELIECYSPKSAFVAGAQMGLIKDEAVFLSILEYRNLTVHTYNEEQAERVFTFIRDQGNAALKELLPLLARKLAGA